MRYLIPLVVCLATLVCSSAVATESSKTSSSPMAGNGHNISFDGRIFIVRQGPGWMAMVLRPQNVTYDGDGFPVMDSGAFSAPVLIQPVESAENALAICEPDAGDTPYRCNPAGARDAGGNYDCYEFVIIDSDAETPGNNHLRQRHLKLWVDSPQTGNATTFQWQWTGERTLLTNGGDNHLMGIEPTVTRDGRLLVWQGHPDNDGKIDVLMYATNDTPCGLTGWHGPHVISHMFNDDRVRGSYPLAERQFRAADGEPYADGALVRGGYPWLFPDGDAVSFTSVTVPCRAVEDPPGCGPRRGAYAVMGYPTNWGLSHIDGGINPDTDNTVRLFFSSPGPQTFDELPVTPGLDVWPFFGSNTSNYAELVFDDGLDGGYAGVWHMNESVNLAGELDRGRTPDTSGYFNTGIVHGATFPLRNNSPWGKALVFDGVDDWVEVENDTTLNPVNAITIEMRLRPQGAIDCDANNNYRLLLGKGNIGGNYSIVLEESGVFQARVRVGGQERAVWSNAPIPLDEWSTITVTYDGASGDLAAYIDGSEVGRTTGAPGQLDASTAPLTIGGPGGSRGACPNGDGVFAGAIDEVRISRTLRDIAQPGNHARFVSQTIPTTVESGATFDVLIELQNTGTTTWSETELYRLGSQSPEDNTTWGTNRIMLANPVPPGAVARFTATLTAPPTTEGTFPMSWRMVQDGVEWFGDTTPELGIEVVADVVDPPDAGVDTGPDVAEDTGQPTEDTGEVADADEPKDMGSPGEDTAGNNGTGNNGTGNNGAGNNGTGNNGTGNSGTGNNGTGTGNNGGGAESGGGSSGCATTPTGKTPALWLALVGLLAVALRRR